MALFPKKYTKRTKQEHKIFAFDIETYSDMNLFYMGSVYSDYSIELFFNKDEMIKYLSSRDIYKIRHYLVATNLMFDFFALHDYDQLKDYNLIFRGSELIMVTKIIKETTKEKTRKRKIRYIDTFHFATKISLANLGKIINIPKLPTPSYISEIPNNEPYISLLENKQTYTQFEYLLKYNIRDSEVTYKFTKFLENGLIQMGAELKPTIASIALNYFRLKYLKEHFRTPSHEECQFMFEGYYGGRTEAFKRGKINNIYYYDFNSLYPTVMLNDYPNPNTLKSCSNGADFYINNFEGLSKVLIQCPDNLTIPLLPLRTKDKLIFPTGIFEGIYTHLELRKAKELGYKILKIGKCIYFTENISIFKDFVLENYNARIKLKKENNPLEYTYKIILNSLYGKFGQRYDTKQEIFFVDNFDFSDSNIEKYKEVEILKEYFVVTKEESTTPPDFLQPIWSIYVTAYGRLMLYKTFEKLHFDNVLYCDTDSILTPIKLEEGNNLGDLKLEHYIKDGIIIKPKFYEINGYVKAKGLKGFNKKENLLQLLEEGKYKTTKFCKLKETLHRLDTLYVNQKIEIEKKINFEDTKRHWYNKTFSINELQSSRALIALMNNNEVELL